MTRQRERSGEPDPRRPDALPEGTVGGLHDCLIERALRRLARPGERVVDLGTGSGALAMLSCERVHRDSPAIYVGDAGIGLVVARRLPRRRQSYRRARELSLSAA